jgi:hypothetical protein
MLKRAKRADYEGSKKADENEIGPAKQKRPGREGENICPWVDSLDGLGHR